MNLPFLPDRVAHLLRRLTDAEYNAYHREINALWSQPRHTSGSTTLLHPPVSYVDGRSFLSAYRAIFEEEIYAFSHHDSAPRIIDGGANVGLATLYWKQKFPDARITAFEPDPHIFEVLRQNTHGRGHEDVELVSQGLWSYDTTLQFNPDGADGGSVHEPAASASKTRTTTTSVPVQSLNSYLNESVDLLKLDIEGAEVEVLRDIQNNLGNVHRVFVEHHSWIGRPQELGSMLLMLEKAGFRIHIQPELVAPQPFLECPSSLGMDHRLNIFAYRP